MPLFKYRMNVCFVSLSLAGVLLASAQAQAAEPEFSGSKPSAFHANYAILPGQSPQDAAAIVRANFAAVIEENFAQADVVHAKRVLDNLSDRELRDLAASYTSALGGRHPQALDSLAQKLDGKRLARLAQVFGYLPVLTAASTHSSAEVQLAFAANVQHGAAAPKPARVTTQAAPTIDMSIRDIYLEFRTAPVGSLSASAGITETAIFAGSRLSLAGAAGYQVGTGIYWLISNYAPELGTTIGGTVNEMVQNINNAGNKLLQGKYEESLDSLLGGRLLDYGSSKGNYSGDYGVSRSLDAFIRNQKICFPQNFKAGAANVNSFGDPNCDPN
ncbi:hypothetical protein [Paraherbaspirillum soli]|uniref:DUF2059 domain-containing protein n=1 Tax=Paraherbaspirillum soli TaxID=631222 RepID=A0ABW0M534_9BURK